MPVEQYSSLLFRSTPKNFTVSQPLSKFPALQCCLMESQEIAGIRQSSVTSNVWRGDSFTAIYSDDAILLLCCRFLDTIRYPLTIMVKLLVANKDWLFSVGVSELISWQTLHQWIYHTCNNQAATCKLVYGIMPDFSTNKILSEAYDTMRIICNLLLLFAQ